MKSSIFFMIVLIFIILVLIRFCFVLQDKNCRLKQKINNKQIRINTLECYLRFLEEKFEQKNKLDADHKSNI